MIVPKKLKNEKINIYKNFNMFDLLIMIIIFAFFSIIFSIIGFISFHIRIILVILCTSCMFPLIFTSKKYNSKNYILVIRLIKYMFQIRKVDKNSKENYQNKIDYSDDKFIILNQNNNNLYLTGFKVEGINFFTRNKKFLHNYLKNFQNMINRLGINGVLIKKNENYNIKKNISFIKNNISLKDKTIRKKMKKKYLEKLIKVDKNKKIEHYYFLFYSNVKRSLERELFIIKKNMNKINFSYSKLNKASTINLLHKVGNDNNKTFQNIILEKIQVNEAEITRLFQANNFEIKKNHIIRNEEYISFSTICKFPNTLNLGWANKFFESADEVFWFFENVAYVEAKRLLNKSIINNKLNYANMKNEIDKRENLLEASRYQKIIEKIANDNEKLKNNFFIFKNKAISLKKLNQKNQKTKQLLSNYDVQWDQLKFQQVLALKWIHFQCFKQNEYFQEIPGDTISEGIPFKDKEMNDKNANIVGINNLNNLIIFDQFKRDNIRKNSNMFILGTSGSGKSTFTKKLILYNYIFNKKIIILDPENEYNSLVKKIGGQVLNFSENSKLIINPLEIVFDARMDNDKTSNLNLIEKHIRWLNNWFLILYNNHSKDIMRELITNLRSFYRDFFSKQIKNGVLIHNLESTKHPQIEDFINYLENLESLNSKWKEILKTDFAQMTLLGKLFNGYSNINIQNNLTTINFQEIFEQQEDDITTSLMNIILNYLKKIIYSNKDKKELIVIIDEAHLLIDGTNEANLNFIFQTTKRIRKYNGSIVLITQNPGDFELDKRIENKTKTIIANMQYSVFFNLKSDDLQRLDNLYKSSGGLTEQEKDFLSNSRRGECIFCFDNNNCEIVKIVYFDFEKQLIF